MTLEQKGRLITTIMRHLKFAAHRQDRAFDEGDTFLALAFRSDAELNRLASLVCDGAPHPTEE